VVAKEDKNIITPLGT